MWQIIKWIFIIVIVGSLVLWVTGYKIGGKTVGEHMKPFLDKPIVKEGIHDLRQLVGEGLKAAGEALSEDVTDSERKELDNLVKQELLKGRPIEGAPGQQALPPQPTQVPVQVPVHQPRPTAEEMLQQAGPQAAPVTQPASKTPVTAAPAPAPAANPAKQQAAPRQVQETQALDEAY